MTSQLLAHAGAPHGEGGVLPTVLTLLLSAVLVAVLTRRRESAQRRGPRPAPAQHGPPDGVPAQQRGRAVQR